MPSFRRFLSFFSYLTSTFWFIFYTEHLFFFLIYLTVSFATLLLESSARFLVFQRSFLNLLKSFFVDLETFVSSGEPRFRIHSERTRYSFSQSKLRKETANLVLRVFRYLTISCNLGDL